MLENLNRRDFLKNSAIVSAGATVGTSLEEKILLDRKTATASAAERRNSGGQFPTGRIGKVKISRVICGGNLINGFAHARDLIYVSSLLRHYFTDEKIMETWAAYKVLAAGAIHPRDGFKYAFEGGADFACVGMLDFQVIEDALIARNILTKKLNRTRLWRG